MQKSTQVIHEKSNPISIPNKNKTTVMNNTTLGYDYEKVYCNQYSLKQNYFDPSKSSPPNEFMIKLYMRYMNMTGEP